MPERTTPELSPVSDVECGRDRAVGRLQRGQLVEQRRRMGPVSGGGEGDGGDRGVVRPRPVREPGRGRVAGGDPVASARAAADAMRPRPRASPLPRPRPACGRLRAVRAARAGHGPDLGGEPARERRGLASELEATAGAGMATAATASRASARGRRRRVGMRDSVVPPGGRPPSPVRGISGAGSRSYIGTSVPRPSARAPASTSAAAAASCAATPTDLYRVIWASAVRPGRDPATSSPSSAWM